MNINCYCVIVNHLCEVHGPETLVLGPFDSRESAEVFMQAGLAANPLDDARVEPLALNSRKLAEVLMRDMGGIDLSGIDGPAH